MHNEAEVRRLWPRDVLSLPFVDGIRACTAARFEWLGLGGVEKVECHSPSLDHEVEFKCNVYENGRVAAGPETLRHLASFSERQIREATGVRRDTIRLIRHGKGVKRSTYEKVINFLRQNLARQPNLL
jgi:hypothetical protein